MFVDDSSPIDKVRPLPCSTDRVGMVLAYTDRIYADRRALDLMRNLQGGDLDPQSADVVPEEITTLCTEVWDRLNSQEGLEPIEISRVIDTPVRAILLRAIPVSRKGTGRAVLVMLQVLAQKAVA